MSSPPDERSRPAASPGGSKVSATDPSIRPTSGKVAPDTRAAAGRPPPWCGRCDERTRLLEVGEERRPTRCKQCHPLVVAPAQPQLAGVDRAIINADEPWHAAALRVIRDLASTGRTFTADDMRADRFGLPEPDDPARWGAAFRAAVQRGWITQVGHRPSSTPGRHGSVIAVWRGRGGDAE